MIAQLDKIYIQIRPSRILPRLLSYFFFEGRPLTTLGRWFNPITFASLKLASHSKIIPQSDNPVFIIGTGRGGTTVLGTILSIHPEIGFFNEPKAIWYLLNHQDDILGNYTDKPGKYLFDKNDASEKISKKIKSIHSAFLRLTGNSVILDKYPEMIFRTEYVSNLFNNPRYIFLHRNPLDTISSTALWSKTNGNENQDWWGVSKIKWKIIVEQLVPLDSELKKFQDEISLIKSQEDMACVEWICTMNKAIEEKTKKPDSFFMISYEDIIESPESKISEICDFIGVKKDKKTLEYSLKTLRQNNKEYKPNLSSFLIEPLKSTSYKLGYIL